MTTATRCVGIAACFFAFSCASTQGSTWVAQPEPGPFEGDELAVALAGRTAQPLANEHRSSLVDDSELEAQDRPRPRLDRTITLGEIDATESGRRETAPAPAAAPVSVTVNNYVQQQPSYDGYYAVPVYSRAGAGPRPTPHSNPTPTHPGQNWPALPNHGTSFPFKTAPASPWR